jgi:hypothetical protein
VRREVTIIDGKIRIKATLSDNSLVELFEYVVESSGQIRSLKYSFHWQDSQGKLRRRWDNAPHYPTLPNAPHHIHNEDNTVQSAYLMPNTLLVLQQIEQALAV